MNNDTDHPDARPKTPRPAVATTRTTGRFVLPTAYGPDLPFAWQLTEGDNPQVIVREDCASALLVQANLGERRRLVAALRALAHDLDAAPGWVAAAPIEPAAA